MIRLKQKILEWEKVAEQALQARLIKKDGKEKEKWKKISTIVDNSTKNSKNQSDPVKKGTSNKNLRKKVDMKEV